MIMTRIRELPNIPSMPNYDLTSQVDPYKWMEAGLHGNSKSQSQRKGSTSISSSKGGSHGKQPNEPSPWADERERVRLHASPMHELLLSKSCLKTPLPLYPGNNRGGGVIVHPQDGIHFSVTLSIVATCGRSFGITSRRSSPASFPLCIGILNTYKEKLLFLKVRAHTKFIDMLVIYPVTRIENIWQSIISIYVTHIELAS